MEGLFEAGIGVMVHPTVIEAMNNFMTKHSYYAFCDAVYEGAWSAYFSAYIHPCDEMRNTNGFTSIQNAFANAYL